MPPPNQPREGIAAAVEATRTAAASVSDRLFGTRTVTAGAARQIPRKTPLRIEPKTYFANERTFLAWMSMAVTLGGVSTALVGFTAEEDPRTGKRAGPLTPHTTALITALLLPLAASMAAYALWIFVARSKAFRTKTVGFHQDWVGPALLAGCLLSVLLLITVVAFIKVIRFGG